MSPVPSTDISAVSLLTSNTRATHHNLQHQPALLVNALSQHLKRLFGILQPKPVRHQFRHEIAKIRSLAREQLERLGVRPGVSEAAHDVDLPQGSAAQGHVRCAGAHADEHDGAACGGAEDGGLDTGFGAGAFEDGVEAVGCGEGGEDGCGCEGGAAEGFVCG